MNVRFLLLSDITADVEFYQCTSCVCLEMRSMGFMQWVTNLSLESMYVDELWLYKKHNVVITASKLWSTLYSNDPVTEETLLNICSVKLVYLCQLHFGVLSPKVNTPEFVMVPMAAARAAKPSTSYQSQQAQPISKPTPVTSALLNLHITCREQRQNVIMPEKGSVHVPSSNSDSGIALEAAKAENTEYHPYLWQQLQIPIIIQSMIVLKNRNMWKLHAQIMKQNMWKHSCHL